MNKTAAILIIGNEILSGRTQDTNSRFLAIELEKLGIKTCHIRVIRDDEEEIIENTLELKDKYNYVFTTGGIGPTHDDVTSAAIAKAFNTNLELNQVALDSLLARYTEIQEATKKMAYIPVGAKLINNPISSAPGFIMENVYVMAGVPSIMKAMFESIRDNLIKGKLVKSKSIGIYAGESKIADMFKSLQNKYRDVEMGSYPYMDDDNVWHTTLLLKSTDEEELDQAFSELFEFIEEKQFRVKND